MRAPDISRSTISGLLLQSPFNLDSPRVLSVCLLLKDICGESALRLDFYVDPVCQNRRKQVEGLVVSMEEDGSDKPHAALRHFPLIEGEDLETLGIEVIVSDKGSIASSSRMTAEIFQSFES